MTRILAYDCGTSSAKGIVVEADLTPVFEYSVNYADKVDFTGGKAEMDPRFWQEAFREFCFKAHVHLDRVGVVALSVTTPGFVPMAVDGSALHPAIHFCDQ